MSQTLTISDDLYTKLKTTAQEQGYESIEALIEEWLANQATWLYRQELAQRELVQQIEVVREKLFDTYGETADSLDLIRADRSR